VNKTTQTVESAAAGGAFHIEDVYPRIDGGRFPVKRVAGERIEVSWPEARPATAQPEDIPLDVIFEDRNLVVLNKRDLIDDAGIKTARDAIAAVLPRSVKVVTATDGKVDEVLLLGLGVGTEDDIANRRTRHDAEAEHDHDDFDSFVVPLGEVADPSSLAARVAGLAERFDVLRVKGFAAVADKPLRLLVQAVGRRVTHQYDRPWSAAEPRETRLVVIGLKGLDRAAIARAVIARPELLLADEPTGNVDPNLGQRLLRLFVELNKSGTSVIIATHDIALMDEYDARRLVLHEGRLHVYD